MKLTQNQAIDKPLGDIEMNQATPATPEQLAIVHNKRRIAIEALDRQNRNVRRALAAVVIANIRKTTGNAK